MSPEHPRICTDERFEQLSWHDNHVRSIAIRAGRDGQGELALEIDHLVEWQCATDGTCWFWVAPATLTFHDVSSLRIEVDYDSVQAAITPFSIERIDRRRLSRPGVTAYHVWTIELNWPDGEIRFEGSGFTQEITGPGVLKPAQHLEPEERGVFAPREVPRSSAE